MANTPNADNTVKTIGKIAIDAIDKIPNPFLKAMVAIIAMFDVPAFAGIVFLAVLYKSEPNAQVYSFGSLGIFFFINLIVMLVLLFKKEVKETAIEINKKGYKEAMAINTRSK